MTRILLATLICTFISCIPASAASAELKFREDFLKRLVDAVPGILRSHDTKTGRFGKGIWIVTDQNVMYPLAAAWSLKSDANPYYHDPKVLEALMIAGDALIEDADENGQWVFRKKDGSTWGKISMPWTYSRWLRAYGLIRDSMPAERRRKWEVALINGYTFIASRDLKRVHNIPAHHAMGLYLAGQLFDRADWRRQAADFMHKVAEEQDPGGFWSENYGPVVSYNFVYSDALGTYFALSKDPVVLEALERASRFHSSFTYPDGSIVETVDERNPYHSTIRPGNIGFSFTPAGRGYLKRQWELMEKAGQKIPNDELASFLLFGQEGPAEATAAEGDDFLSVLDTREAKGQALVRRKGPWFVCLSALHCPVPTSRWIQDRQNLVSVYHDRVGLILGGGNTKLQPLWSTFTVGDPGALRHAEGDESPDFEPPAGLFHVPSEAAIDSADPVGLNLKYGPEDCRIQVAPIDARTLRMRVSATRNSEAPVQAHLTLPPHVGQPVLTEKGASLDLKNGAFTLQAGEAGRWISHAGWRLSIPEGAVVVWPALPHNPYRKDGRAEPSEGRVVVTLPFSASRPLCDMTLTVD